MVSNTVLKNNSSTKKKRLTRNQLEKQQRLKALYAESLNSDNPAAASSRSNSEGSESSRSSSREGGPSGEIISGVDNNSSSQQRSTRSSLEVAAKENVNKNHSICNLSIDSIMSPIPLKEDNGQGGERANENNDVLQSAVTPSPKPPSSSSSTPALTPEQRSAHPLTGITEPGPNDCLFGRGGGTNHHPGNKSYRLLVESRKDLYLKSKRLDKPLVAMGIISDWRGLTPPGRFLKQDDKTKFWNDVGDKKAREKTSQALREKTPVKSREGEGGERGGGGEGRDGDYRPTARFEPGVSSPVGRHVKRSSLARDHSLGTEIVGSNEISLEGFSWDDSDKPVVRNENANVSPTDGGGGKYGGQRYASTHNHASQHHYPPHSQQHHGEQHHQYGEYQQQQQQHQQPRYPYVREHSLSNNPLSDASTSHAAPPATFGEHPPPPPPSSYYGHNQHYPPSSGYGPPPPPPPGHHQAYHPHPPPPYSQHEQYHPSYSQQGPPQQQPPQRSREHSLQMNPLKGASTSQPARDFEQESHSSYDSSRMPPLPPPSYEQGPPPPPYYGYGASPQHGQGHGWPTPPPGHPQHHASPPPLPPPSPQFSYHSGSNPSAFGRYNSNTSDGRSNSLRSLGSSVDAYYASDRRDSAATSGSVAASGTSGASVGSGTVSGSGAAGGGAAESVSESATATVTAPPPPSASPTIENPASAGTSMDYSKIAELIRESSDKSSSTTAMERSSSWDEGGNRESMTESGYEDGILRSKSMPHEESGGIGGGSPRSMGEMAVVNEEEHDSTPATAAVIHQNARKPSLLRKLSGGKMAQNKFATPATPNGILRPGLNGVYRPEPVKRDTSNQPETFETKRSIKRVVLSRDQSAVSRRLKEQQGLGMAGPNINTNATRVSSKLTKSEMLDRKMSVEINKLGLYDSSANNARSLSYGVPPLDRMTTDDVLASLIDDDDLNSLPSGSAGLMQPPKPMAGRVTTIDAIAMDIHANGSKNSGEWEDALEFIEEPDGVDVTAVSNNPSGVNADIAEKWLKGET